MKTTPQERLALTVVTLLLVGGAGARALRDGPESVRLLDFPAEAAPLNTTEKEVERGKARAKPLEAGERIDVNKASPDELDRLPKVGPALAKKIFEKRPYQSLDDLDEVPDVGPAVLEAIKDRVTFGPAPSSSPRSPAQRPRSLHSAPPSGERRKVDLNRASAAELDALPGIGPSLAERILEFRRDSGAFRSARDLERVRGIGPATARKLAPLVSP